MVKVIVINGAGTSGKDTFIDLFTEVCAEHGTHSVYRFSSVDKVKYFATCMGWDGVKDDKGRRFLSDIKDAMTRYNDAPFEYMNSMVNELKSYGENCFVFFHVREPEEIHKMVSRLNASTLFIERPSVKSDSFTNHADKNVENYHYQYHVMNDGTLLDLKDQAIYLYHLLEQEVAMNASPKAELQAT